MEIKLHQIKVSDLVKDYKDSAEDGVRAYGGLLDVRPPYQREFVYKEKQRDAVIETLTQGFPLNVMYWAVREDGSYEIIDGQQRTISICQYVTGEFAYMFRYFHNLTDDEQQQILDYELQVYLCSGTDSEKLKWFKTINIAGEELTEQELRNAVYAGSWLADAKRYFSKGNCVAYNLASKYVSGEVNRQAYLETAIRWISDGNIEPYMAKHQHDGNAVALWNHFSNVINWAKAIFPKYRKEMKGVEVAVFGIDPVAGEPAPEPVRAVVHRLHRPDDRLSRHSFSLPRDHRRDRAPGGDPDTAFPFHTVFLSKKQKRRRFCVRQVKRKNERLCSFFCIIAHEPALVKCRTSPKKSFFEKCEKGA